MNQWNRILTKYKDINYNKYAYFGMHIFFFGFKKDYFGKTFFQRTLISILKCFILGGTTMVLLTDKQGLRVEIKKRKSILIATIKKGETDSKDWLFSARYNNSIRVLKNYLYQIGDNDMIDIYDDIISYRRRLNIQEFIGHSNQILDMEYVKISKCVNPNNTKVFLVYLSKINQKSAD